MEKSVAQELEKVPAEGKEVPNSDTVPTDDAKNDKPDAESEKDDPKKRQGWPAKVPFSHGVSRILTREAQGIHFLE